MGPAQSSLVTAYPLPPDYYTELDVEDVRTMQPPPVLTESVTSFGSALLVGMMGVLLTFCRKRGHGVQK